MFENINSLNYEKLLKEMMKIEDLSAKTVKELLKVDDEEFKFTVLFIFLEQKES